MKKKIIGLTIVGLVALASVVSAANWGKFKGNEIVQVKVENKVLNFGTKTPAIIYNGSAMIPLYQLNAIGINYEYESAKKIVTFQNESKRNVELKNQVRSVKYQVQNLYSYLDVYRELADLYNSLALLDKANRFFIISAAGNGTIPKDQLKFYLSLVNETNEKMNGQYSQVVALTNRSRPMIPKTNIRIPTYDTILDNYQLGLDKLNEYVEKTTSSIENNTFTPSVSGGETYEEAKKYFNQAASDAGFAVQNLTNYIATYNPAP
ncbi:hypothetical protein [Paenibacillus sp. BC26]|uniref:hypothetical protein n=1 Tax=Paenibacillus sp. BC26 TaxID=1881032 RepID=UPI0008E73A81|nr:hypothetical protein [Paenibacillus sp. BC26]SFS70218.1 hypothetical protein SAMN05428962_2372 [Paenibacillus sp. BC26]